MRASMQGLAILAMMVAGCSAEIAPGNSSDRVGRTIQPIIGGVPSSAEHDGVVVLAHFADGVRRGMCSATLVAPNLLLTARHCVSDADSSVACNTDGSAAVGAAIRSNMPADDLVVFVGKDGALPSINDETKANARGTKLIVDGSLTLCNHDLAFVLLDRPVDAPIATMRLSGGPKASERVNVVGWGVDATGLVPATRQMRGVAVTGIGPTLMPGNMYGIGNAEVMFGEAACLGDSGGPAFTKSGVLVGVASRVGNGKPRDPANDASTCTGETAHSIYTHLGQSAELVKQAFAEAGNVPVVEPPPIEDAAPAEAEPAPKNDAQGSLQAEADIEPPAGRPLEYANCAVSNGRRPAPATGWLVMIAFALAASRAMRSRRA